MYEAGKYKLYVQSSFQLKIYVFYLIDQARTSVKPLHFVDTNECPFTYSPRAHKDWAVKLKMVSMNKNLFHARPRHIVATWKCFCSKLSQGFYSMSLSCTGIWRRISESMLNKLFPKISLLLAETTYPQK